MSIFAAPLCYNPSVNHSVVTDIGSHITPRLYVMFLCHFQFFYIVHCYIVLYLCIQFVCINFFSQFPECMCWEKPVYCLIIITTRFIEVTKTDSLKRTPLTYYLSTSNSSQWKRTHVTSHLSTSNSSQWKRTPLTHYLSTPNFNQWKMLLVQVFPFASLFGIRLFSIFHNLSLKPFLVFFKKHLIYKQFSTNTVSSW
jgi:hypothetical protein